MLPDPEIAELLAHYASSHDACNALVDSANVAGGRDNITVLIVDIAQGITHGI
jgi:serine/threonine protein phosphatase PrpC